VSLTRECGDCHLCCKLPEIPSTKKESFNWCKNCTIGVGCNIYSKRPDKCKDFLCAYIMGFTDVKPSKSGFMIFPENEMAYNHKIFTVYCEEYKLDHFIKNIQKDYKMLNMIEDDWAFHIRYNNNDSHLAIYDPRRFGNELNFINREEYAKANS